MNSERTFKQLDSKASESVSVGHHNLRDISCFDFVQKGEEAFSLEVEPGSDVSDDLVMLRAVLFEVLDLPLEVSGFFLFGRGDSGVKYDTTDGCGAAAAAAAAALLFFFGGDWQAKVDTKVS